MIKATIYGRGQMTIPVRARRASRLRAGDVVSLEPEGDGRLVLVRLERPERSVSKARIRYRKGSHAVGTVGKPITSEQIKAFLADFP